MLLATSLTPLQAAPAASADDLAAAQERADRAADAVADAQVELAFATDAVADARRRVAATEASLAESQDRLTQVAVRQYVQPPAALPFLVDLTDTASASLARQYAAVAAGGTVDALGQFRARKEDLEIELASLAEREQAEAATLEGLRRRQAEVMAELDRLTELDRQRREREAREAAAAAAAAEAARPPARSGSPASAAAAPMVAPGSWVCPVAGPNTFSDDFGAPRAGGRGHEGNDILAPRGTPVVANVSGRVSRHPNNLGGLAYFLYGSDGNTYYGAHLDAWGPAQGSVSAGSIIGYVGNSGDAAGGPTHLHFEMSVPGRGTINPYPTLRRNC